MSHEATSHILVIIILIVVVLLVLNRLVLMFITTLVHLLLLVAISKWVGVLEIGLTHITEVVHWSIVLAAILFRQRWLRVKLVVLVLVLIGIHRLLLILSIRHLLLLHLVPVLAFPFVTYLLLLLLLVLILHLVLCKARWILLESLLLLLIEEFLLIIGNRQWHCRVCLFLSIIKSHASKLSIKIIKRLFILLLHLVNRFIFSLLLILWWERLLDEIKLYMRMVGWLWQSRISWFYSIIVVVVFFWGVDFIVRLLINSFRFLLCKVTNILSTNHWLTC